MTLPPERRVAPDDPAWLGDRLAASPLLDEALARAWRLVLPFLTPDQRYELAATLLAVEQAAAGAAAHHACS